MEHGIGAFQHLETSVEVLFAGGESLFAGRLGLERTLPVRIEQKAEMIPPRSAMKGSRKRVTPASAGSPIASTTEAKTPDTSPRGDWPVRRRAWNRQKNQGETGRATAYQNS